MLVFPIQNLKQGEMPFTLMISADPFKKYAEALLEKGVLSVKIIEPQTIETAPWVAFKCQFGCPHYGKNLCCPPHAPTYEQTRKIIDSYQTALLFHTHERQRVTEMAEETAKLMFFDGYYKVIAFGSGPCTLCKECTLQGCINPAKARPSMEACGIDVFQTVRNNGYELNTLADRQSQSDNFGLILIY